MLAEVRCVTEHHGLRESFCCDCFIAEVKATRSRSGTQGKRATLARKRK